MTDHRTAQRSGQRAAACTIGEVFDPRWNNFDLLRLGFAALVIYSHCFSLLGLPDEPIAKLFHYETGGELAVDAFLVISGFLVTRSACNNTLDRYVLSRVVRIVPGLALLTLVEVFVIGPLYSAADPWTFLSYVGFRHLRNVGVFGLDSSMYSLFPDTNPPWLLNGSLWTIPIECSFYIILPFVFALPRPRLTFTILYLASIIATRIASYEGLNSDQPGPSLFTNVHLFHFLDLSTYFLAGAAAWFLRDRLPFSKGAVALCLIGLFAASGVGMAPVALNVFLPYLVLYGAVCGGYGTRLKERIGDLSYGTYLYGFPVTLCLIASLGGQLSAYRLFATALIISGACAWISWHTVERPSLRFRVGRPPGGSGRGLPGKVSKH